MSGRKIYIASNLAAGSDQLGVQVGLERNWTLQVTTPFPLEVYRDDFRAAPGMSSEFDALLARASVVVELDGVAEGDRARRKAYEYAGLNVLEHCDVLVAIWDGQLSEGVPDSVTGNLVRAACLGEIPVIWIPTQAPFEPKLLEPRWPAAAKALNEESLRSRLAPILLPPEQDDSHGAHGEEMAGVDLYRQYLEEGMPGERSAVERLASRPWSLFIDAFVRSKAVPTDAGRVAASERDESRPHADSFEEHFARADALAGHFMGLYRSSFVVNYLLGALAVTFALLPLPLGWLHWDLTWFVGEFLFIVLILANRTLGTRLRWHRRALDYRILAELLRHAGYLAPIAQVPPYTRPPVDEALRAEGRWTWVNWYFRSIVREVGLPNVSLSAEHVERYRSVLCDHWLAGQEAYHRSNGERLHRLEELIHRWVSYLFLATLAACSAHIVEHLHILPHGVNSILSDLGPWLTLVAAAAPAWAAALHGIGAQAELATLSDRSLRMAESLAALRRNCEVEVAEPDEPPSLTVARKARHATEVMLHEVLDWRMVYQAHQIPLS